MALYTTGKRLVLVRGFLMSLPRTLPFPLSLSPSPLALRRYELPRVLGRLERDLAATDELQRRILSWSRGYLSRTAATLGDRVLSLPDLTA